MKDWTLINEHGDRIERVYTGSKLMKPKFSYWSFLNGERITGALNKVKKAINDYRGSRTKWEEHWE